MQPTDFDRLYRHNPDPFDVGTTWYEQRKLSIVLAALPQPRYRLAWDAAAGTGHLAERLTERCAQVIATDASRVAVDNLSRRSTGALVLHSALPDLPPQARTADVVVVSEVLYYLPDADRVATVTMLGSLRADLVCVHWRHHPDDAYLSGADAQAEFESAMTTAGHRLVVRHDEPDFVLSVASSGEHP